MALAEGVNITEEEALHALEHSTGSWRDAISATEDIVMEVKRAR